MKTAEIIRKIINDNPEWDGVCLSVCSYCGKIYGAKDSRGAGDMLSHGICDPCFAKYIDDKKEK